MRILKENTIALVIDIQEKLLPAMFEKEEIERNIKILINGLNALNIPIIVTEQYPKGLGNTINSVKELFNDFNAIEKLSFSCMDEPKFVDKLKSTGKKNVVITGIEAHVCVNQTVIDLIANGFTPIVVVDCISSRKPSDKQTGLERMKCEGAIFTTYEAILFELCRFAGNEAFKIISKLVK